MNIDPSQYSNLVPKLIGDNPFAWSFWISAIFLLAFILVKYYIMKKDATNDLGDLISEYFIDIEPIILSIIISRLPSMNQWNGMFFMAFTILVIVICSIMRNKTLHIFSLTIKDIIGNNKAKMSFYILGVLLSIMWIGFAYLCVINK